MRARTKLAITAVTALLALALTPTIAPAETSSEVTYCCAPEHVESFGPADDRRPEGEHRRKKSDEELPADDSPGGITESERGEEDPNEVAPGEGEQTPPGGRHDRRPAKAPKRSISEARPVSDFSPLVAKSGPDRSDSSDGGSSPILLVLIAVAALAVLSAGIAFFNERSRARRR